MGTYVLAMVDGERKLLMQGDTGGVCAWCEHALAKQCLIGLRGTLGQQRLAQGLWMPTQRGMTDAV